MVFCDGRASGEHGESKRKRERMVKSRKKVKRVEKESEEKQERGIKKWEESKTVCERE